MLSASTSFAYIAMFECLRIFVSNCLPFGIDRAAGDIAKSGCFELLAALFFIIGFCKLFEIRFPKLGLSVKFLDFSYTSIIERGK